MLKSETTTAIKSIPWFLDLSPESIQRLNSIAEVLTLDASCILFNEGDKHPYLYIILDGKVRLESFVPGFGRLPIFTAESLDVVGWSSMTPVVRQKTCTARVITPTNLLGFNADDLMACCEKDCELGFVIMRRLANIVATQLLNNRVHLLEIITSQNTSNSA